MYELDGTKISLPLAHTLPEFRRTYPLYSANIGRIAQAVYEKHPDLTLIDIGANIGDTAIMVRSRIQCPILCIDGNERFIPFLKLNTGPLQDVYIEQSFVGDVSGVIKGEVVSQSGTGRIVRSNSNGRSIPVKTLSNILADYPRFSACKIVKIDTDGFDVHIIYRELELLSKLRAVLFFEYDPFFFGLSDNELFQVFTDLRNVGYAKIMVYENRGDYLLSVNLSEHNALEDLHNYFRGRHGRTYADICAFHRDDVDLHQYTRQREIAFFRQVRPVE